MNLRKVREMKGKRGPQCSCGKYNQNWLETTCDRCGEKPHSGPFKDTQWDYESLILLAVFNK